MTEEHDSKTRSEGRALEFGSKSCICSACGTKIPHSTRGVPCSELKCPGCGGQMRGTQCSE
jgi:hypothetical protein